MPDTAPEVVQERGPAAYIAEFLGTLGLVFFVTMAVTLYVPAADPATGLQPFIDFSVIGLVHVFVLFMLIQTLAIVSGAHFNPAVTLALAAVRRISPPDAAIYIVVQLAGGVAGALLTKAFLLDEGELGNYAALAVTDRIDGQIFPGLAAEAIGTFFLVWAIMGVAVNPAGLRNWAGLVVGATLGFLVMVFGPLTGAGFNPARAFGPALVGKEFGGFDDFVLVFVIGPALGALLAAFIYTALFMGRPRPEPEPFN